MSSDWLGVELPYKFSPVNFIGCCGTNNTNCDRTKKKNNKKTHFVDFLLSQSSPLQGLIVPDIMLLELWPASTKFLSRLGLMQYRDHLFQFLPVKKKEKSLM